MFNSESKTTGREQVDVTGLIGQYAHGNEPSHHMAYLYNYVGKPEKTKEKVHFILNEFYKNTPDGLIGNEDCGQMSAWYVLSALGIYNVSPGNIEPSWSTTEPYFENIKVNFENKTSKIITKNMGLSSFGLEIIKRELFALPERIITVPIIQAESKAFKDKLKIELKSQNANDKIYFKINNYVETLEKKSFELYNQPFEIQQNATISCYVLNNNSQSNTISAQFFKKPNNYTINIKSKYNPQYHAGGPDGLLDGILGTENWRKGDWQGYQSQDFEAVVDLQVAKDITEISARFLQDQRSWILMPTKVEYYISDDNVNFTYFGSINNTLDPKIEENTILNFTANETNNKKARYVKVIAKNFGKLPEWHQGFGGDAFIFVDEIIIK
jgi:hypothetical protein